MADETAMADFPEQEQRLGVCFTQWREHQMALHEIRNVEIFRAGTWNGDEFTVEDLDDMIANFSRAGFQVPVKLGHTRAEDAPAVGWISALRRVGDKLIADIKDIPEEVFQKISGRAFDQVSSEIIFNAKRAGETFKRLLSGVALLGAHIPAVSGLKPIRESEFFKEAEWSALNTYTLSDHGENDMADDVKKLREQLEAEQKAKKELEQRVSELEANQDDGSALELKKMREQLEHMQRQQARQRETMQAELIETKAKSLKLPALRDHVRALMQLATADDERTVQFSTGEGKERKTSDERPVAVIDDLIDRLNGMVESGVLRIHSAPSGDRFDQHYQDDPSLEVDRRARKLMSDQRWGDEKYMDACERVLSEDAELARAYRGGPH